MLFRHSVCKKPDTDRTRTTKQDAPPCQRPCYVSFQVVECDSTKRTLKVAKNINSQNPARPVTPAFVISAVVALWIGVAMACPTPDALTLILGIALALIPFVVLLTLTIRFVRMRGIQLPLFVSVLLGIVIGVSTGFLSVSAFHFGSYLLA